MVYVDSSGNVVEHRFSIIAAFLNFFSFIIIFFKSLFGLDTSTASANDNRSHLRRTGGGTAGGGGGGGGGGRWPGSGGPGGPGRGGGGPGTNRRQIGRLPQSSGMSCPPMGGG